jgi:hypothetical protein
MWMRTNGTAQPNENVFISHGPNSITFRWAGETVPYLARPPLTPGPEPVNFAVTLFENGEIRFAYGSGNQNLVNGRPIAGCNATTPLVGISRGIGNAPLFSGLAFRRPNFKDAEPITWVPASGNATNPIVRLESPAVDESAKGILNIRGVIYEEDPIIADSVLITANILIDGVFQGTATTGVSRTDICGRERLPGCPFVGFQRSIDLKTAGLKPGSHTFQIRAVNAKGGYQDYPAKPLSFTIEDGDGGLPKGAIEATPEGTEWTGPVNLRGFAYSTTSRVRFVDILIDGIAYTRATYGLARTDVCAAEAAGATNCPAIGWVAAVNTPTVGLVLPNGPHTLQIRITEDNGRVSVLPESPIGVVIKNAGNTPPQGVVTEPSNAQVVSGTINVSGYAWDADGRVSAAILLVDNVQRANLRYGSARPEVCTALNDVPACPNIGFDGTFDTRILSNGSHRLGVLLVDNAGASVTIPGITTAGMNITVNNP